MQGGTFLHLRRQCIDEMVKRDPPGFAVGGLSGGEEKTAFCRTMKLCADLLPKDRPRYGMGIGYVADLVVCTALGYDMFDCVFPTRTARFGVALTDSVVGGRMRLRSPHFAADRRPIDEHCECSTCARGVSRAYLHAAIGHVPVVASLITVHNLMFMLRFMRRMRLAIVEQRFPAFVEQFMIGEYGAREKIPQWIRDAMTEVNVAL